MANSPPQAGARAYHTAHEEDQTQDIQAMGQPHGWKAGQALAQAASEVFLLAGGGLCDEL